MGASPFRSHWEGPLFPLITVTVLWFVTRIVGNICPSYCTCNVTMQLFYHVSCERATLENIPQELPSKNNTTLLNVKWNHIRILREKTLNDFKQLQLLNMEHNGLEEIDGRAFHHCLQLRLLQLAHNKLRTLDPDMFVKNTLFQFIDLSNNKLNLPRKGPFIKSNSLLVLNLTETGLSEVPVSAFSEIPGLRQLELSNNLLRSVDEKALSALADPNATVLVSGNPLRCDCALKRTWRWIGQRAPLAARSEAVCDSPDAMRGRPWVELRTLDCGEGAGAGAGTYALYAIAGLLVVIAAMVGAVVITVRRRRRRKAASATATAAATGVIFEARGRLAPPVGEYIEVLGDPPLSKSNPVYDVVVKKDHDRRHHRKRSDGAGTERYVSSVSGNGYLAPARCTDDDGPDYVNMKGPPLPVRHPSDGAPAPQAPAPATGLTRPCSVPLLEGCDFYEVVE